MSNGGREQLHHIYLEKLPLGERFIWKKGTITALNSKPLDLWTVITLSESRPSGADTERSLPSVSHHSRKPVTSEPPVPTYSRTQSRKAVRKAGPPQSPASPPERSSSSHILYSDFSCGLLSVSSCCAAAVPAICLSLSTA